MPFCLLLAAPLYVLVHFLYFCDVFDILFKVVLFNIEQFHSYCKCIKLQVANVMKT